MQLNRGWLGLLCLLAVTPLPSRGRAGDGDPIVLGQDNASDNTTRVVSGEIALWGVSDTDDGALVGEGLASDGYGVRGTSPHIGVNAVGGDVGVYAVSDYGTGVEALTYDGVALHASTAVVAGTALRVDGRAEFEWSGRVSIPAGSSGATLLDIPLTSSSLVLATLQQHADGVFVEAAVPDVQARSITIHLNRRVNRPTVAAWFVID